MDPYTPNIDKLAEGGIVWTNLLGQVQGAAMANVLSSKVNSSGHLPFTIEKSFSDSPDPEYNIFGEEPYWTGKNAFKKCLMDEEPDSKTPMAAYIQPHQLVHILYSEGILVGYRWYESKKIKTQFPFGHGLSYTTFEYDNIKLNSKALNKDKPISITFNLKNTGKLDGKKIVQLYIGKANSKILRAVKELKGFK